ncbi:MAG: alpha-glucan family phosphorylase [Candidatus Levybacteria bacterium]|nr:alpha-glucan family phosphorylase [Candidatus Levybacteria bacterium]
MNISRSPLECAYFSMEIMLESDIPTYAGGLGILAGDLLRSCADMEVPVVGVSLVYNDRTYRQIISSDGSQNYEALVWHKNDQLTKLPERIEITIQNEKVIVGVWRYDFVGSTGFVVPVYLLDTDFLDNSDYARSLTKSLYEGNVRLAQEVLLGVGGVKMLRQLGYHDVKTFHMNEGHASFVPLGLLQEKNFDDEQVKKLCVFTTHTPIPEGHDRFDYDYAHKVAGDILPWHIKKIASEKELHMTILGMSESHYIFGVSQKHGEVSSAMFPQFKINSITNGVHHRTWVGTELANLYDKFIPEWFQDPKVLSEAVEKIPDDELWRAHQAEKRKLLDHVNNHLTSVSSVEERENPPEPEQFDIDILTISLARRLVPYKRPLLLYSDLERLLSIGEGKLQIIQCGKAAPGDEGAKNFVKQIIDISKQLRGRIKVVYLENYSPLIARQLVRGSDVWLNTPRRPLEASGTSGMKAAMNGVLNFSVLDGWWIEGYKMDTESGFSIGPMDTSVSPANDDKQDIDDMYNKLQNEIIPLYYNNKKDWISRMKHAITLGAYFNTHRCIEEYRSMAWNK